MSESLGGGEAHSRSGVPSAPFSKRDMRVFSLDDSSSDDGVADVPSPAAAIPSSVPGRSVIDAERQTHGQQHEGHDAGSAFRRTVPSMRLTSMAKAFECSSSDSDEDPENARVAKAHALGDGSAIPNGTGNNGSVRVEVKSPVAENVERALAVEMSPDNNNTPRGGDSSAALSLPGEQIAASGHAPFIILPAQPTMANNNIAADGIHTAPGAQQVGLPASYDPFDPNHFSPPPPPPTVEGGAGSSVVVSQSALAAGGHFSLGVPPSNCSDTTSLMCLPRSKRATESFVSSSVLPQDRSPLEKVGVARSRTIPLKKIAPLRPPEAVATARPATLRAGGSPKGRVASTLARPHQPHTKSFSGVGSPRERPSPPEHSSPTAHGSGGSRSGPNGMHRSIYELAAIQRRRHEAWVQSQQALREEHEEKECTFEPMLCDHSRRLAETRVGGIIVRLSPRRQREAAGIEGAGARGSVPRRVVEDEEQCTFAPRLCPASRHIVRSSPSLSAQSRLPVSDRLHEDHIRRERTLYALARVAMFENCPPATTISQAAMDAFVERHTGRTDVGVGQRIKSAREDTAKPPLTCRPRYTQDRVRSIVERLATVPESMPEAQRKVQQGLQEKPHVGVVSTIVRSMAVEECLASWHALVFEVAIPESSSQDVSPSRYAATDAGDWCPDDADQATLPPASPKEDAPYRLREHVVSALLSPMDWVANSVEDLDTVRRIIGALAGQAPSTIGPSTLTGLRSYPLRLFVDRLTRFERTYGPQVYSRRKPRVDVLLVSCPPQPKRRAASCGRKMLPGCVGFSIPKGANRGASRKNSCSPAPNSPVTRQHSPQGSPDLSAGEAFICRGDPEPNVLGSAPLPSPKRPAFPVDVERVCADMEALLGGCGGVGGRQPLPRTPLRPDSHDATLAGGDIVLSPMTVASCSSPPRDVGAWCGGVGSGVPCLQEPAQGVGQARAMTDGRALFRPLVNHADPVAGLHADWLSSQDAARGPEFHTSQSPPVARKSSRVARPVTVATASQEGVGIDHPSLLLLCAQMGTRRQNSDGERLALRRLGAQYARDQLSV